MGLSISAIFFSHIDFPLMPNKFYIKPQCWLIQWLCMDLLNFFSVFLQKECTSRLPSLPESMWNSLRLLWTWLTRNLPRGYLPLMWFCCLISPSSFQITNKYITYQQIWYRNLWLLTFCHDENRPFVPAFSPSSQLFLIHDTTLTHGYLVAFRRDIINPQPSKIHAWLATESHDSLQIMTY